MTKVLLAIHLSSKAPLAYHRQHPPKHIIKLLCYKDLEWIWNEASHISLITLVDCLGVILNMLNQQPLHLKYA